MQTEELNAGVEKLTELTKQRTIVIICAEAVLWRCHRSLLGDALLARNYDVEDIYNHGIVKPHKFMAFAHVHGEKITYPEK